MPPLDITLAGSPTTWGVDVADNPNNPPWHLVLDEIAAAGLNALELGPVGYLPNDPPAVQEALAQRELTAVGSFVFESLHDPGAAEHVQAVAERACRMIRGAGGRILVIIDRPGRVRAATAGQSDLAPRLPTGRWREMLDLAKRLADLAHRHGLTPVFHPHAGSYVEFADEIDRLLDDSDLLLCLDTGHLTYAGMLAEEAIAQYASRLAHLHLKDVDPNTLQSVRRRRLGFWRAIACRIFCPLGVGVVDLHKLASALASIGYQGHATIEQDRVPGTGTPLTDLREGLDRLTAAGYAKQGSGKVS